MVSSMSIKVTRQPGRLTSFFSEPEASLRRLSVTKADYTRAIRMPNVLEVDLGPFLDMIWLGRHLVSAEGKFVSFVIVVARSCCMKMEM